MAPETKVEYPQFKGSTSDSGDDAVINDSRRLSKYLQSYLSEYRSRSPDAKFELGYLSGWNSQSS